MKSSLEGTNSPAEWGEERTNKLKDRSVEIIQFEEQKEKIMKKNKPSLRDWDMNIIPAYAKWESQKEMREKGRKDS